MTGRVGRDGTEVLRAAVEHIAATANLYELISQLQPDVAVIGNSYLTSMAARRTASLVRTVSHQHHC